MGRYVRVSSRNPRAAAVCDRCGSWRNHDDLRFQFKYAGNSVMNTNLLVCRDCLDPLEALDRPKLYPPDGLPIRNPRFEPALTADTGALMVSAGVPLTTELGDPINPDNVGSLYSGIITVLLTTDDGYILTDESGSPLTL